MLSKADLFYFQVLVWVSYIFVNNFLILRTTYHDLYIPSTEDLPDIEPLGCYKTKKILEGSDKTKMSFKSRIRILF